MKYMYLTLNWVFGVLLAVSGVAALFEMPLVGGMYIIISLFLLPPVRGFVYSKTNNQLSVKVRSVIIIVLVAVSGVLIGVSERDAKAELVAQQNKERADKVAKLNQANKDYFVANKSAVMTLIDKSLAAKDYQSALNLTSKYVVADDTQLSNLHSLAQKQLNEFKTAQKIKALLVELKSVPGSDFEKNKSLYHQLVGLDPDNKKYKKKRLFYATKIEDKKQKELVAKVRKERIEKQFSPWDGSHYNLDKYIKKAMNDPSSYEHDKTVYWDQGSHLIVKTIYRGKNAFGGVVRNFIKVKVSLDGQILQVLDAT